MGPYKILGRLGSGGMGTVYKATDEKEMGRKLVAIKLIKKGLDTDDILGRFELEKRLLGALDHPNIARLITADTHEDGRPYFVMEYVDGAPIDQYCDKNRISIQGRLQLFQKVCSAVHHAHQNLIVHRDLKPSNILVTAKGEPKLLDFGIAKMLNPDLAQVQAITRTHFRVMTPDYASPEQVRGESVNVQSDVYSLGVLLYELLCGHRPYHFEKYIQDEIIRVVCEVDPERPSTALTKEESRSKPDGTTETISPAALAQRRDGRLESLRRSLTGDLDDIVLMAMEKAPNRRYPSADAFSADLNRYLSGLPVEARRTGARTLYQTRKFLLRHKGAVAAALIVLLTACAGGALTASQWRRASIANSQLAAEAQARTQALEEKLAAEEEARRAIEDGMIASLYTDVLWKHASSHLSFTNSPGERQEFWDAVSDSFEALEAEYGSDNEIIPREQSRLKRERARLLMQTGYAFGGIRAGNRGDFTTARDAFQKARNDLLALRNENPDDTGIWKDLVDAQLGFADALRRINSRSEAFASYERAIELAEDAPPDATSLDAERLQSKARLAYAQSALSVGEQALARRLFEREIHNRRQRTEENPQSLTLQRDLYIALFNYGELLRRMNDAQGARAPLVESLERRQRVLAQRPEHTSLRRDTALGMFAVAMNDLQHGNLDLAQRQIARASEMLDELTAERPDDARNLFTKAFAYAEAGEVALLENQPELLRAWTDQLDESTSALEQIAAAHTSLSSLRARRMWHTAELELREGEPARAMEYFRMCRDQFAAFTTVDPADVFGQLRLAHSTSGIARSITAMPPEERNIELAKQLFEEAMRIFAAAGDPTSRSRTESELQALNR